MTIQIQSQVLTPEAFAPYGQVIEAVGKPDKMINQNHCGRFHNLATPDIIDGHAGISIFDSEVFSLPYKVEMVERHPLGSQAFIPMHEGQFLIIVADDDNGVPVNLTAFLSKSGQGVNIARNVWHGVLCPIDSSGLYAVIDRIGDGSNLEEHWFETTYSIE